MSVFWSGVLTHLLAAPRALILEPSLLVVDELMPMLDAPLQEDLLDFFTD